MTWEVGKRYETRAKWSAVYVGPLGEHHIFWHPRDEDFIRHNDDGVNRGGNEDYDILPPAPPPPQLTATDLVMRRAVVRYKTEGGQRLGGFGVSVSPNLFYAGSAYVGSAVEHDLASNAEYCIPPPTIPDGWEPEWRPLSEVDLTR